MLQKCGTNNKYIEIQSAHLKLLLKIIRYFKLIGGNPRCLLGGDQTIIPIAWG